MVCVLRGPVTLAARLAAAVIASALDFRDTVTAEVRALRGEPDEPHRYDPASTTLCGTERADPDAEEHVTGFGPALTRR